MASIRIRRVEGAPVASIRVWLPGGSTAEAAPGLAWVSGRLLVEGTRERDWRRIADEAETRGMSVAADAGYEAQGVAVDALADDWSLALEWAAELIRSSTFPEDRCRWVARQTAADLEQLADHPDVRTSWAFARQLYGPNARGRPLQGSPESLERLTGEQCRRFHAGCLSRGVIVSVAGDVDEIEAGRRALELFGDLPNPSLGAAETAGGVLEAGDLQRVELEEAGQAHWFGGAVTVSRADPAYWPLALVAVVLGAGGGLNGRIPHRVREREGLAYSCRVSTVSGAGRGRGCSSVAVGTSPERAEDVGAAVSDELASLVENGVTATELSEARAYLLGREPFARETARQWATLMAQAELNALPLEDPEWVAERWNGVTEDEVLATARSYLDPARLRVTIGR